MKHAIAGDMLERLSNGRMRSTPHRVRASAQQDRLSFPFFLDPGWNAEIVVLDHLVPTDAYRSRWDGTDLATISGVYGDYLLSKISKVFPELFAASIAAPRNEWALSQCVSRWVIAQAPHKTIDSIALDNRPSTSTHLVRLDLKLRCRSR